MDKKFSLTDGIEHHKAGNFELADEVYLSLQNLDPYNVQLLCLRGLIAQSINQPNKAIELFQKANVLQPDDFNIQLQLGISYSQAGEINLSNPFYEQAIALAPNAIEPLVNYGNNLCKLKLFDKAFIVYQKAMTLDPTSSKLNYNIGTLFLNKMDPDGAIKWLESAVSLDPMYTSAWNSLGAAFTETDDLDGALAAYQKASSLDPEFIEPLFNQHAIYIDLGMANQVINVLQKAIAIDENNNTLKFFLGIAYQYYGENAKGVALIDSISKSADVHPEISSWNYLQNEFFSNPKLVGTNTKTIQIAIDAAKLDGLNLEFGVYNGKSIRRIALLVNQEIHGFDSFEGLPEKWNDEPKGSYSAEGYLPEVPKNVVLHKGWFNETLPVFIKDFNAPIRFLHIDCDLYSSTKTILDLLADKIIAGTVIVFDEFIGYKSWDKDEFKAFNEAAQRYGWKYELLTFSFVTKQVALIIK
jgi:tetratricopeptide (TPR) repeat protein